MRSLFSNALILAAAMAAEGEIGYSKMFGNKRDTDTELSLTEKKDISICTLKKISAYYEFAEKLCGIGLEFEEDNCEDVETLTAGKAQDGTEEPCNYKANADGEAKGKVTKDVAPRGTGDTVVTAYYKRPAAAAASITTPDSHIQGFSLAEGTETVTWSYAGDGTVPADKGSAHAISGNIIGVRIGDRATGRRLASKPLLDFEWVTFTPAPDASTDGGIYGPATKPRRYDPWVYVLPIIAGLILIGLLICCLCCKQKAPKTLPPVRPMEVRAARASSSEVEYVTNALQIRPPVPEVVVDKLPMTEVTVPAAQVHVRQPEPRIHMQALSTVISPPEPVINIAPSADQRIRVDPARVEVHAGKPRLIVEENDVHVRAPQHEIVVQSGSPMYVKAPQQEVIIRPNRHVRVEIQEYCGRDERVIIQKKPDSDKVIVKKEVVKEDSEKVLVKASDVSMTAKDGKAVTGQMALFKASNDVRGSHRYEDTSSSDE